MSILKIKKDNIKIQKIICPSGLVAFRVMKRIRLFIWFVPYIWVNAGSWNDGYYGTDYFFSYEDAVDFARELMIP